MGDHELMKALQSRDEFEIQDSTVHKGYACANCEKLMSAAALRVCNKCKIAAYCSSKSIDDVDMADWWLFATYD